MEPHTALILLAFIALVMAAVVFDLRTRRIPNSLVLAGMALGLLFQTVAPSGGGLFNGAGDGSLGPAQALLGAATGLALFMPMYALRTLGAADVKLLGMVGMWLGAEPVAWAALWALLAGGALALAVAVGSGVMRQVLNNLHDMLWYSLLRIQTGQDMSVAAPSRTTGRLPYALAIACGTTVEVVRQLMRTSS
ncbi:A24 family peptidase [Methylibium sp.]|uniref:A24 family peptidase n=1 Tax=Methylibium sp. TaxID=2067992 RepID=UPI00286AB128|nr:A24 family peptidase [Methylibium sp.]